MNTIALRIGFAAIVLVLLAGAWFGTREARSTVDAQTIQTTLHQARALLDTVTDGYVLALSGADAQLEHAGNTIGEALTLVRAQHRTLDRVAHQELLEAYRHFDTLTELLGRRAPLLAVQDEVSRTQQAIRMLLERF